MNNAFGMGMVGSGMQPPGIKGPYPAGGMGGGMGGSMQPPGIKGPYPAGGMGGGMGSGMQPQGSRGLYPARGMGGFGMGGFGMGGFGQGMGGFGMGGFGQGMGVPPWMNPGGQQFGGGNGYMGAPSGVPFAHSPYTQFGSPFGMGLPFWQAGFGAGPQYPDNMWTPPTPGQSPQSPVPPIGMGDQGPGDFTAADLLRFHETGRLPDGDIWARRRDGMPGSDDRLFNNAPAGFEDQYRDVYGRNTVPAFQERSRQEWLDWRG